MTELAVALLMALRGWVPRACAWAFGITGVALLAVPALLFANAEGLLLPAVPWTGGG